MVETLKHNSLLSLLRKASITNYEKLNINSGAINIIQALSLRHKATIKLACRARLDLTLDLTFDLAKEKSYTSRHQRIKELWRSNWQCSASLLLCQYHGLVCPALCLPGMCNVRGGIQLASVRGFRICSTT